MSEGLLTAILAVQAEAPTLPKDKVNPHFRSSYTPLDTIVERIGPILNKHGLVWLTMPCRDDSGEPALKYRLAHAGTGEVIEDTMPLLLSKADAQGMGSAITYARRYSLCAVLNLVADDDDDGNAARPSGASSDRTTGKRSTGEPSAAQKGKLAQVMRPHKPVPSHVLAACLLKVGVKDVPEGALESGAWIEELTAGQMSALIDLFQSGALPTGKSDIPNDLEPAPDVPAGDDVPFEVPA